METSLLTTMNNQNIRIILLHDVRFAKVATKAKEIYCLGSSNTYNLYNNFLIYKLL